MRDARAFSLRSTSDPESWAFPEEDPDDDWSSDEEGERRLLKIKLIMSEHKHASTHGYVNWKCINIPCLGM